MGAVMKLRLENHGSIWLARPLDTDAVNWLNASVPDDTQYFGNALVIEPRYVGGFCDACVAEGVEVD
jgi:hypothetical protein